MPQDTQELVVAAHGDVYIAPVGTTLPTNPTAALNAAFRGLGLITEDGVTLSVAPDIESFNAWQRRQPVRRELTGQDITLGFALEQWNAENVKFAYSGGDVSEPSPGIFRYDFPSDEDSLEERAIVVDWQDGDKSYRIVFSEGNVTEETETQLVRNDLAVLPITFSVNSPTNGGSPGYLLVDDAAFHS